jgi:hypothetical protein
MRRKLSSMRTASTATVPCGRRWSAFGSWQALPSVTLIPHGSPPHALPATIPFGWCHTATGLRFHWKLLQSYGNGDENGPTLSCLVTSPKVSDWSLSFTDSLALTLGCQVGVVRDLPGTAVVDTHQPSAKCGVSASNDLTDFRAIETPPLRGEAHQRHTTQRYSTELLGFRRMKADRGSVAASSRQSSGTYTWNERHGSECSPSAL